MIFSVRSTPTRRGGGEGGKNLLEKREDVLADDDVNDDDDNSYRYGNLFNSDWPSKKIGTKLRFLIFCFLLVAKAQQTRLIIFNASVHVSNLSCQNRSN